MPTKIKIRRDTKQNWESTNPVLADGELVVVYDEDNNDVYIKIGNGTDAFNDLPFVLTSTIER